jgi:hypothetical protein
VSSTFSLAFSFSTFFTLQHTGRDQGELAALLHKGDKSQCVELSKHLGLQGQNPRKEQITKEKAEELHRNSP